MATDGPSRAWYWVGGAVGLAGLIFALVWVVQGVVTAVDRVDDLQRVPVPGEGQVVLDDPGGYTVYVEAPGVSADDADVPSGEVGMEPAGGGERVEFSEYDGSQTYDWSGREGRAVLTFEISEPGTYEVQTRGDPDADSEIAIGRSVFGGILGRVLVGALVLIGSLLVGTAIVTVTAIKRPLRPRKGSPAGP